MKLSSTRDTTAHAHALGIALAAHAHANAALAHANAIRKGCRLPQMRKREGLDTHMRKREGLERLGHCTGPARHADQPEP